MDIAGYDGKKPSDLTHIANEHRKFLFAKMNRAQYTILKLDERYMEGKQLIPGFDQANIDRMLPVEMVPDGQPRPGATAATARIQSQNQPPPGMGGGGR